MGIATPADVLDFWFSEIKPAQWWSKDEALDSGIGKRFGAAHQAACAGELAPWREQPSGRLAEIIVLDQFSRNIYRDSGRAFACDGMALVLAQEALLGKADVQVDVEQRAFFYMPYMHSESCVIHEIAVDLFTRPGAEHNHAFELRHKFIIDRFGRYPHRNVLLGRSSSPEEIEFLNQPDSSF
ncbi:MAG: DUF924 family protein [Mariprofundaceae bacterium]|nr:DUF924 family protein [Mariprofundaceae bacterium]